MGTPALTLAAFEDLLDRWGEEVETWPPEWRAAAFDLLAAHAEARASLGEARRLRRLLQRVPPVRAPAGLAERILQAAAASTTPPAEDATASAPTAATTGRPDPVPAAEPAGTTPRRWPRPALAVSACLLVGLAASVLAPPAPNHLMRVPVDRSVSVT